MSKYTTELRYICEHEGGYSESVGANNVDEVLSKAWDKIFTTRCTFFDEAYRPILCKKILKHYYLREIGCETVGIFKLWVNTKLEEIMPYYNMLYESALLEFDPFKDTDYTKEHNGKNDGTKNTNNDTTTESKNKQKTNIIYSDGGTVLTEGEYEDVDKNVSETEYTDTGTVTNNGEYANTDTNLSNSKYTDTGTVSNARDITSNNNTTNNSNKTDRYSDTPQGTINNTDLNGDSYLTNVRIIGENNTSVVNGTTNDDNLETRNLGGTNNKTDNNTSNGTTENTETRNLNGTNNKTETRNLNGTNNKTETRNLSGTNNKTDDIDYTEDRSNTTSEATHNTDSYIEHIFGKMNSIPYSDLLQKFRETFLNIDLLVIDEFDELFLQLW